MGWGYFPSRMPLQEIISHPTLSPHLFVSKTYKPTKCQELNGKVGNLSLTHVPAIFVPPQLEKKLQFQPLVWNFLAPVFAGFHPSPPPPLINVIYFAGPTVNFSGVLGRRGGTPNTTKTSKTNNIETQPSLQGLGHSVHVTAHSEATSLASTWHQTSSRYTATTK